MAQTKQETIATTATESLNELFGEEEKNSEPKCSTHEEAVSDEEMNRKATDLKPVNKINSLKFKEELKGKRFSLLIKPSLYNRLKDLAEEKGTSVNNVINVILESVLEAQKGK